MLLKIVAIVISAIISKSNTVLLQHAYPLRFEEKVLKLPKT